MRRYRLDGRRRSTFETGRGTWVALIEMTRLRPTGTVLVTSAAGGVGSAAVQLASAFGCRVLGAVGCVDKIDAARRVAGLRIQSHREGCARRDSGTGSRRGARARRSRRLSVLIRESRAPSPHRRRRFLRKAAAPAVQSLLVVSIVQGGAASRSDADAPAISRRRVDAHRAPALIRGNAATDLERTGRVRNTTRNPGQVEPFGDGSEREVCLLPTEVCQQIAGRDPLLQRRAPSNAHSTRQPSGAAAGWCSRCQTRFGWKELQRILMNGASMPVTLNPSRS